MVESPDSDRDRALFQPVDRNFILGRRQYDIPQQRYRREATIRDRFAGGLQDLRLFQRHGDPKLLEKLIPDDVEDQRRMRDDVVSAIALFFELHVSAGWDFEDTLHRSIEEAYTYAPARRNLPRQVVDDVQFEAVTHAPPDSEAIKSRIRQKLENGDELTDHEIAEAVKAGDIDTIHWLRDYVRERQREDDWERWFERVTTDLE